MVPLLTSFTKSDKKKTRTREELKSVFEMSDEAADKFMSCFERFSPESIKTNTTQTCSHGSTMTCRTMKMKVYWTIFVR